MGGDTLISVVMMSLCPPPPAMLLPAPTGAGCWTQDEMTAMAMGGVRTTAECPPAPKHKRQRKQPG